jgi:hypothetical protein
MLHQAIPLPKRSFPLYTLVLLLMLTLPRPEDARKRSILRNPLLYTSSALAVVGFYVVFVVFLRWHDDRQLERRMAKDRAEKQLEQDRATIAQLGGKDLGILMFYGAPAVIHAGQPAQLCYGVSSAKHVTLEPQKNPVWPSPSRCVEVSPRSTTTYVLTIDDGQGHTRSQSLTIKVE